MNPTQAIFETLIHAFGETSLQFALEACRAAIWAAVFYGAARRFVRNHGRG